MIETPEQVAQARIAEALETKATELVLRELGLSVLPDAIGRLTNLQSLDLSSNQLSALPEAIGKLTALESLNLHRNQLSALPEAIGKLTRLQSLDLRSNQLSALPEAMGKLTKLRSLDIWNNQVSALPEAIGQQLTELRSLDLSSNQLSALPEAIGKLTKLRTLHAWRNQLSALPEAIGQLTQLQSLDVEGNELSALPDAIGQLTQLQSLNLGAFWGNQLSTVPEAIGKLTQLQSLDLAHNQLSALPEAVGQLKALQSLNLSSNQLSALPEAVGQLKALQSLNLSSNQLSALPEAIWQLKALQSLDLSNNQLSALPEAIGELTAVQSLDLSGNRLSVLPEPIRKLTALKRLLLHDNEGLAIPPDVLGPTALDLQRGSKEPVKPVDILAFYFRSRVEPTRPLHEAKILIVGQPAVGKTSLVRALRDEPFDAHERTTEGINIAKWSVPLAADDEGGAIEVNIWDFGGQEIMHATHQFFLTTRSLYIIVIDARKGEDEGRLHYWLKIVQSYGADSPIAVVINKHEDPHYLDLNENRLRQDYTPNILAFFKTSCEGGTGIVNLKEWLEQTVRTLPHVADPMPISFFYLKEDLEARNVNYLTFAEYQKACVAHGVNGKSEQGSFLRILHALGSVLNFDDPESPYQELRDTNVLNPDWITDGVYRIINNKGLAFAGGVLEMASLGKVLTDQERFPPDRYDFIIGMMRKFELCFEFPDTHGRTLLVPELLSPNEPFLDWTTEGALHFEYDYEVLPPGLICRFIVKMNHNLTRPPLYWRSGVVLEIDGNRALVRAAPQAARIYVSVSGPDGTRRNALSPIRDAFRAIHASIKALGVAEKVPLPEDPSVLLDYEDLIAFERSGVREYPVRLRDGKIVQRNISDLLDGVVSREERSEEFVDPVDAKRRRHELEAVPEPPREQERRMEPHHETPTWERVAIFAIGVAFVAALLGIALGVPQPSDFQIFIFRVVLALGAGALGALMPGFIEVTFRNWLRAGGAIALFVIVYMINPPALIAEGARPPDAPPAATEQKESGLPGLGRRLSPQLSSRLASFMATPSEPSALIWPRV